MLPAVPHAVQSAHPNFLEYCWSDAEAALGQLQATQTLLVQNMHNPYAVKLQSLHLQILVYFGDIEFYLDI